MFTEIPGPGMYRTACSSYPLGVLLRTLLLAMAAFAASILLSMTSRADGSFFTGAGLLDFGYKMK